jgi:arylsulfatase A-like enzyme
MKYVALMMTILVGPAALLAAEQPRDQPNVLFIAIDDLNDWVGCLGGHEQVRTPHIDRLAERGVLFSNAHCQAPICQPSRTSLLTGTFPHRNGVYTVEQRWRKAPLVQDAVTLPQYFREHGYRTLGAGKIFHREDQLEPAWDEWGVRYGWNWMGERVGPDGISGLPTPSIFDFGPFPAKPEEMNDMRVTDWVVSRLDKSYDKPFFLAVGLITPHLPLFTPPEFYEQYPLDTTRLPVTLPGDLDDLPAMGRKFTRYFDTTPMSHHNITRNGLWHKAVASYLACATFTDHCVGRLLDALDDSPHAKNTIIVLWSDHGFHLGEKMHWEKRSLWEESTRVPLIFSLPGFKKGSDTVVRSTPGAVPATVPDPFLNPHRHARCTRPVGLIDIYPTLIELCDLPEKESLQGRSLSPLLQDPTREWDYPALTTHHPGNHAVRSEHWRYIRYANGDEELYDHRIDPHEFHNLAQDPQHADMIRQLAEWIPDNDAPYGPQEPRHQYTQEFDWSRP